jgi:ribosomal 50S subunit-associated protein YjgA (DUF615 family)
MSLRTKAEPLAHEAVALAKHIASLIEQGLSRDDVLERLANPAGVGAAMIARAVARRDAGAAYLGRVMRQVEPEPEALIDPFGEDE